METLQLPPQWSTFARQTDWVFYFIYYLSVAFFVAICAAMVYFVWKYRRKPGVMSEPSGHNNLLEIGWTVSPLVLLVFLFHVGYRGYVDLTMPPADAMEIRVRARKWAWDFEYANGGHATVLHVPVHRPVKLILSSEDVIHSLYIPAFRVKRDAVPGYYSTMWFEATQTGETDFFCTEYCGAAVGTSEYREGDPNVGREGDRRHTGHFSMIGRVKIETRAEFSTFLESILRPPTDPATGREVSPEVWGSLIYRSSQCNTCHSIDGSAMTGPSWRGLFGRSREFVDGTNRVADANYLRESILQPNAHVVRGFNGVMPSFAGTLRDQQIDALIAYIRTLR
ncbi:MAG: cytochrome c oxidase subunit II [Deltaproteobacteria bacterium]|nr:cytochrome c oxidase subunit II [Deltaproteobacteria bacterium]